MEWLQKRIILVSPMYKRFGGRWDGDAQCEGPKGASKTPSVRFILTWAVGTQVFAVLLFS